VKSFQLELQENVSDSRRWIETRLMTKQQGEWVGYSYAWNEDQTDATLVESPGKDKLYAIQSASGAVQQQKWRYPSRTECMVCHTRAARYVLGLSTLQMNRMHDYGEGVVMNQLEAYETMGLFQASWVESAKSALRTELSSQGMSKEVVDEQLSTLKGNADQLPVRSKNLLGQSCDNFERLLDPYDPNQVLEIRARSFLHSNCAYCHIESGGGNAQMDLAYWTPKDKMKVLGVPPIHHHFDLENANLVAPGSPARSILLHRVGTRETGKMPPIGSNVVDDRAVGMLREWINSLK
jgi:mono/diheme cytochrome c family protein